jgi:hypothetical protein
LAIDPKLQEYVPPLPAPAAVNDILTPGGTLLLLGVLVTLIAGNALNVFVLWSEKKKFVGSEGSAAPLR